MVQTPTSSAGGGPTGGRLWRLADDEGTRLRDAALALGVSAADFDRIV
jgi:hypothetical protein